MTLRFSLTLVSEVEDHTAECPECSAQLIVHVASNDGDDTSVEEDRQRQHGRNTRQDPQDSEAGPSVRKRKIGLLPPEAGGNIPKKGRVNSDSIARRERQPSPVGSATSVLVQTVGRVETPKAAGKTRTTKAAQSGALEKRAAVDSYERGSTSLLRSEAENSVEERGEGETKKERIDREYIKEESVDVEDVEEDFNRREGGRGEGQSESRDVNSLYSSSLQEVHCSPSIPDEGHIGRAWEWPRTRARDPEECKILQRKASAINELNIARLLHRLLREIRELTKARATTQESMKQKEAEEGEGDTLSVLCRLWNRVGRKEAMHFAHTVLFREALADFGAKLEDAVCQRNGSAAVLRDSLFWALHPRWAKVDLTDPHSPELATDFNRFKKDVVLGKRLSKLRTTLGPHVLVMLPVAEVSDSWIKGLKNDTFDLWLGVLARFNPPSRDFAKAARTVVGLVLEPNRLIRRQLPLERVSLTALAEHADLLSLLRIHTKPVLDAPPASQPGRC